MYVIPYPSFDPVILSLWGPLAIRWYGVAYMVAVLFGYLYVPYRARFYPQVIARTLIQDSVTQALLWAVVGGRVGYMVLYEAHRLWEDPLVLFRLWEGGMSFHGGLAGVALGLWWYTSRHKVSFAAMADLFSLAAPFGLMCGRIANFINGELYGRITSVPWAMIFPEGGPWPRHPSQLYEALAEGVFLFCFQNSMAHWTRIQHYPGALGGMFTIGYGVARFAMEFFREPDVLYAWLPLGLTWGQVLSLPLIVLGLLWLGHSGWLRHTQSFQR